MLGHPFGARKMTLICAPRTIWLSLWVHMQDHSSNFAPVGALTLRLQKPNVRDDVLFVIGRRRRLIRRTVRNVWIEGWLLHHIHFGMPGTYAMVWSRARPTLPGRIPDFF